MNLFLRTIPLAILILTISCTPEEYTSKKDVDLIILDSFKLNINDDVYRVMDMEDSGLLAINSNRQKIALFNTQGEVLKTIQKRGSGPDQYTVINKLGFGENSDEIVVVDATKMIRYKDNEFINTNLSLDNIVPILSDGRLFFVPGLGYSFTSSNLNYSPESSIYFDSIHTISLVGQQAGINNIGGFPKSSIYREKIFSLQYDPRIFIPKNEKVAYMLFPYEPVVYPYDLVAQVFLDPIRLSIKEFDKVKHRTDQGMESMLYLLQQNPSFKDIVVGPKYVLVFYRSGLDKEDHASSLEGYNQVSRFKRKYELVLADKESGDIIGQPFFDDRITHLIGFDKDNNLIFQHNNESEEVIIYKCKITAK